MKRCLLFAIISMFVLVNESGSQQIIKDKVYELIVPDEWTQTNDLPQGIDVGFRKTLQQGEVATFFFHHEVMPPEAGDPPANTSDMQDQWDSMIKNKYPDARIVNRELPRVEGRILINGTYELTDNGAKVRRRYTYFLSGRTAFVVQCSVSPSEWTVVLSDFDNILASLKTSGSAPQKEKVSDDSAQAKLKTNLPTLLGSFPSGWMCSLKDVSISTGSASAKRTLEIKIAFERGDIQDIYKATKLMFEMMSAGKTDADLNAIPDGLRAAASNSSEFIKYVGQVWGCAYGYIVDCEPPIEQYRVSILDSSGLKIGHVSISREDGIAILSGKVTADEARRITGMYKFDVQDVAKVKTKNTPNDPNEMKSKSESAGMTTVVASKEFGISFTVPDGLKLYDTENPGPMASKISRETPYFLVNPTFADENINIKVIEGVTQEDLEGMKKMLDANPNTPLPQYKRISVSFIEIGKRKDIKAVEHIFQMKGNVMGQLRQITFVLGKRGFTVSCGTSVERFDAANKNFFEPFFRSIDSVD